MPFEKSMISSEAIQVWVEILRKSGGIRGKSRVSKVHSEFDGLVLAGAARPLHVLKNSKFSFVFSKFFRNLRVFCNILFPINFSIIELFEPDRVPCRVPR